MRIGDQSHENAHSALKLELVGSCDVNTEIYQLSKIRNWLKKYDLTRKTDILGKLREIQKVANESNKKKIESLIKY